MREQQLKGEESEVSEGEQLHWMLIKQHFILQLRKKIQEKAKDGTLVISSTPSSNGDGSKTETRKRGRWDQTVNLAAAAEVPAKKATLLPQAPTWDGDVSTTGYQ